MFTSARLQLTLWYLLIIMTISVAFSIVIYEFLSREVERFAQIQSARFESRINDCIPTPTQPCTVPFNIVFPIDNSELVLETKKRIVSSLFFINGTILFVSGALGYFLAGRTLKPIKEMVEDQNRFISDASHELKTPLTSLKTAFEVHLRNKKRNLKESDELVQESITEVNKLQQLSESLLFLAGQRKPSQSVTLSPVELKEIISAAIKRVSPLAKKKKITLKGLTQNIAVIGNAHTLTDLFVILLDNAIKYSPTKSEVTITSTLVDKNTAKISVTDEGKGISPEDLEHIFERFFRSDTARSKIDAEGYGLGLSIAQQLAQTNKATLSVESTVDVGSTFSLTINCLKPITK
ncbi:MAG: two-component system, OmpR family, sensor histidine kinase CiaH [Patescibacteria group bacterium]|nr:two-component system, OmpR family, sensor histidine kinase CiaH [Patescibacteria group bacterium]